MRPCPSHDWLAVCRENDGVECFIWLHIMVTYNGYILMFNELAPVLTKRGVSLKLKGKIYDACVQRVLVYGSETWAIKAEDLARLRRAERMMVRRMCGVSLKDRKRSDELLNRLGIECVENKIQREG